MYLECKILYLGELYDSELFLNKAVKICNYVNIAQFTYLFCC